MKTSTCLILLLLAPFLMFQAHAAPWSTSKPNTTDSVRIDFIGHRYGTIMVAAPSVGGEYRSEIERQTAIRIARNSDNKAMALSYIGAFGNQTKLSTGNLEKKLNDAHIDGIIVVDLHGALKNQWDSTQLLDLASLGNNSIAPEYKDVPLRERDGDKRKIHARVVLFDFATRKIVWEADIKIDVVRSRADGAHVAEYLAKQIGKNLSQRGIFGSKTQ